MYSTIFVLYWYFASEILAFRNKLTIFKRSTDTFFKGKYDSKTCKISQKWLKMTKIYSDREGVEDQ